MAVREGKNMLKVKAARLYLRMQARVGGAMASGGRVGAALAAAPALLAVAAPVLLYSPAAVIIGSCASMRIAKERVCASLSGVVNGIRGHEEEVMLEFGKEIAAIKEMVVSFSSKIADSLRQEMGASAVNFNLDDHDISHAVEEWLTSVDISKINTPQERERLKQLVMRRIRIEASDSAYIAGLNRLFQSESFLAVLHQKMSELKQRAQQAAQRILHNHAHAEPDVQAVPAQPAARGAQDGRTARK